MSSDSSQDSRIQPLQFKGELMDFDLGVEVDHRKRRRNRTTQSCLNCHTSKRKCDRKRPCQRCIQLGLTGLCVYEVDDPALRDDPNVDENTRLRNRIAELESLVRELRGKPHPRWAEPNFCDGDATEKWHSRSSRRTQAQFARQRREFQEGGGQIDGANVSPVIKVEQDATQRHLYRLSQSPPSLNGHPQHTPGNCSPSDNSSLCSYPSSGSGVEYNNTRQNGTSLSMSNNNDLYYPQPYIRPSDASPVQPSCTCLTNPAAGHPLIALTHQLQSTMEILRQLPEHANRNQCLMMKRITDLNDMMHGGTAEEQQQQQYNALPTPTESELLSPVSASSHASIPTTMQPDWPAMTATQTTHYDNYFPSVNTGEQGVYHHKSYHMN